MRGIDSVVKRVSTGARESVIEAELVRRVEAAGGICEKVKSLSGRGYPDRTCFLPGAVVWLVELKRPRGGVLSVHQKRWRARLALLGIEIFVVKNVEDSDSLFARLSDTKAARAIRVA